MNISKNQLLAAQFASPSHTKRELSCVLHDGKTTVATDSFRLLEVTNNRKDVETGEAIMLDAKSLAGVKIKKVDGILETSENEARITTDKGSYIVPTHCTASDFPQYLKIMPERKELDIEIKLDGEYLAEIAAALAKIGKDGHITMRVPEEKGRPVYFTAECDSDSARALLMPLNR